MTVDDSVRDRDLLRCVVLFSWILFLDPFSGTEYISLIYLGKRRGGVDNLLVPLLPL